MYRQKKFWHSSFPQRRWACNLKRNFGNQSLNVKAIYMKIATYTIAFDFDIRPAKMKIPLMADVELHFSEPHYIVRNIRMPYQTKDQPVLPEVDLKKVRGIWVHSESGKESELSLAIGKAIDSRKLWNFFYT